MRHYSNLDAWRKAHALALQVFHITEGFPKSETFQMAATLRRGSMAVPMRIAEACGQDVAADFRHGLSRARAAGLELEYALLLSRDLQLLKEADHDHLRDALVEVRRMLSGLIKAAPAENPDLARQ